MGNKGIATLDFGTPVELLADAFFSGGGVTIGLDAFAQNGAAVGGVSSTTVNLTIAANSNRAILMLVGTANGPAGAGSDPAKTVSSITGAGATWSKLGSFFIDHSTGGNGSWNLEAWIGLNPSTGAQTVTVNLSGTNTNNVSAVGYSIYNVHQTTPLLFYNGGSIPGVAYGPFGTDGIYTISTGSRTRAFHAGMMINSTTLNKNIRASNAGDNLVDDFDSNPGHLFGQGSGHGFYGHFGDAQAGISWLMNNGSAEQYGQVVAIRAATGDLDSWDDSVTSSGSGVAWTPRGALLVQDGVLRSAIHVADSSTTYYIRVRWKPYIGTPRLIIAVYEVFGNFSTDLESILVTGPGEALVSFSGAIISGFLPQYRVEIRTDGIATDRCFVESASLMTPPLAGSGMASVTIFGETGIVAGSAVEAYIQGNDSTGDHTSDEHQAEEIQVRATQILAGTGFTLVALVPGIAYGQQKVRWAWF